MKRIAISLLFCTLFPLSAFAQNAAIWNIEETSDGTITAKIAEPPTYLDMIKEIIIILDKKANPVNGTIQRYQGNAREMIIPEELFFYWDKLDGTNAVFDFLKKSNKTDSVATDKPISKSMYGKLTRIISKSSIKYNGVLVEYPGNPDWLILDIRGKKLNIYRSAISAIEQVKQ